MHVERGTVDDTGTLHHCYTRNGQQFGLFTDNNGKQKLVVYGSVDFDVPPQTIALDQDEADQLATLLHDRSVDGRSAALDQRFDEIARSGLGKEA